MKVYTNIEDFKGVENAVATIGTFDGVHIGHQQIINRLKEIAAEHNGEVLLLTFFPHPRMVLQPDHDLKLITTRDEKIKMLEHYGIDHLMIYPFTREFSRMTAVEYVRDLLVNQLKISRLVIGYDHQFGRNREGNFEHLQELSHVYGFEVEEISAQMISDVKVSSTKIRNAILAGNMKTALRYLGHPFEITGTVVQGKRLGRQLGFPTANIHVVEDYKIIPPDGVYAVWVRHNGKRYRGMLNIGVNPTVAKSGERTIEVNIFRFTEEIYGDTLTIEFVERIRDEVRFESLDELQDKLAEDKAHSLRILI